MVLLGDSEVGKTSFSNRFFQNTFTESFLSSIGIDNDSVFVKVNEELFKLTIWDTAGQERFRSLPKKYYQNADGILLLYDVTKQETFDNITTWMKDIKDNTNKQTTEDGQTSSNNELTIFLIGNKFDKTDERVVSKDKAEVAEVKKSPAPKIPTTKTATMCPSLPTRRYGDWSSPKSRATT